MSQINPFTHVVIQSALVQRQATVEKERQLRQAQTLEKDAAAQEDVLEHQVESTEEVPAAGDESEKKQPRQRRQQKGSDSKDDDDEQTPHIDLTA